MANIKENHPLHQVKDALQEIKENAGEGLTEVRGKIDEIESRIDKLDADLPRGVAKEYTGPQGREAGHRALGRTIDAAFRKFHGDTVARDFDNTDAGGGTFVPEETFGDVVRIIEEQSLPRKVCRVLPMVSETMVVPTLASIVSGTFLETQGTANGGLDSSGTTFHTPGNSRLSAKSVVVLGKLSRELTADAVAAMTEVIGEIYADAIASAENKAFLSHDGTSTGQPFLGLFEHANGTGSTQIELIQGAAGTGSNSVAELTTLANLTKALTSLPVEHQGRASWIMSPTVWAEVIAQTDGGTGRPLVGLDSYSAGAPKSLLGQPVYLSADAPTWNGTDDTSDTKYIAVGDFSAACVMGDRQQIEAEVSDHVYFSSRERALMVSARVAFKTVRPDAIKILATNPS